jgi:hypothetical protein
VRASYALSRFAFQRFDDAGTPSPFRASPLRATTTTPPQ